MDVFLGESGKRHWVGGEGCMGGNISLFLSIIKMRSMSITIAIPPKLEQRLRDEATRKGLSVEEYIAQMLIASQPDAGLTGMGDMTEDQLLQRVQLNIPQNDLEEYYRLAALGKAERLNAEEHEKLLVLTNRIETAHADRMRYVLALARLRGVSPEEMVVELGIQRKIS
jgi:hypothetical protein